MSTLCAQQVLAPDVSKVRYWPLAAPSQASATGQKQPFDRSGDELDVNTPYLLVKPLVHLQLAQLSIPLTLLPQPANLTGLTELVRRRLATYR